MKKINRKRLLIIPIRYLQLEKDFYKVMLNERKKKILWIKV